MSGSPPRPADDEAALCRDAAAGDREARAAVYHRHAPAVARRLRALTGDRSAADDLLQDVFVTAFGRLGTWDGRVELAGWLQGIALNVARNDRRKRRRRAGLWARFARPTEAVAPGPDAALEGRELAAALYRELDELDDGRREAFVLRVIEQCPLEEAARLLGTSPQTVSRRALEAERRLRRRLDATGGER